MPSLDLVHEPCLIDIELFVERLYLVNGKIEDDHVYRVARFTQTDDEYIVALLHDAIEDGLAMWSDLEALGLTQTQRTAIALLTRTRGSQTYAEYIDKIVCHLDTKAGRIAANVKTFDLFDHLSPYLIQNIGPPKVERYLKALDKLSYARCAEFGQGEASKGNGKVGAASGQ